MTKNREAVEEHLGPGKLMIVTVVKDDLSGLKRTEESVRNCAPKEIWNIVTPFDDSETHKYSLSLLRDGLVNCLIPDEGLGVYSAMNTAIESCSLSAWLWFINSGDQIASKEAVYLINQNIQSGTQRWFYGGHYLASEVGQILGENTAPQNFIVENQLFSKHYVSHQALVVANSLLTEISGFDTRLQISADWDLIVRLSLVEGGTRIDTPLSVFYMGGLSTVARAKGNRELLSLRNKYLPKKFLLKSYYWFMYRSIRNQIVLKIEKKVPKGANFVRKLRFKTRFVIRHWFQ
jgi:hypothetical protein